MRRWSIWQRNGSRFRPSRSSPEMAAAKALEVKWTDWAELPDMKDLHARIRNLPEFPSGYPKDAPGGVLAAKGNVESGLERSAKVVQATYTSAFNHHGSIGPSCAL